MSLFRLKPKLGNGLTKNESKKIVTTSKQTQLIAVAKLTKEKVDKYLGVTIAEKVWYELGSRDVRDVFKIARLANNAQEVIKSLN